MGQVKSNLTKVELEDLHEVTGLPPDEIYRIHTRFMVLAPDIVKADKFARLPKEIIVTMPELRENPFQDRMLKTFSSSGDGSMTFDDFLDMMTIFSNFVPLKVKAEYAFRIYDFNGDDMITDEDIKEAMRRLLPVEGYMLNETEMDQIVEYVMKESDIDHDNMISLEEFEHALSKMKNFMKTFYIER